MIYLGKPYTPPIVKRRKPPMRHHVPVFNLAETLRDPISSSRGPFGTSDGGNRIKTS